MVAVLSDPALYTYTGGSVPTVAELRARYRRQAVGASPDGSKQWLNWMLRLSDERRLVGFVQATISADEAELAWLVAPSAQGAGLASEATAAVADWLRTVGVTGLSAHIHPDNAASGIVARRLGLERTTVTKDGETRWSLLEGE